MGEKPREKNRKAYTLFNMQSMTEDRARQRAGSKCLKTVKACQSPCPVNCQGWQCCMSVCACAKLAVLFLFSRMKVKTHTHTQSRKKGHFDQGTATESIRGKIQHASLSLSHTLTGKVKVPINAFGSHKSSIDNNFH